MPKLKYENKQFKWMKHYSHILSARLCIFLFFSNWKQKRRECFNMQFAQTAWTYTILWFSFKLSSLVYMSSKMEDEQLLFAATAKFIKKENDPRNMYLTGIFICVSNWCFLHAICNNSLLNYLQFPLQFIKNVLRTEILTKTFQ